MALSAEEIAKLKTDHARIVHVDDHDDDDGSLLWEAVFRAPTKREFDAYLAKQDQGMGTKGLEQLARSIVVYPSREAFDALLETHPGIPISLGNSKRFKKIAGLDGADRAK